jgi:hypothetical protein
MASVSIHTGTCSVGVELYSYRAIGIEPYLHDFIVTSSTNTEDTVVVLQIMTYKNLVAHFNPCV